MRPFAQQYSPYPLGFPLTKLPRQKSPLKNSQRPCPCLRLSRNQPQQQFPFQLRKRPFPITWSKNHCPEYTLSPDWSQPKVVSKGLVLNQQNVPSPFFLFSLNQPMYKFPVGQSSTPFPSLMLFLQMPQNILPLLQTEIPSPFFRSPLASPQQISFEVLSKTLLEDQWILAMSSKSGLKGVQLFIAYYNYRLFNQNRL